MFKRYFDEFSIEKQTFHIINNEKHGIIKKKVVRNLNGVLLVHKEVGMTSFDVVAKLRKILHTKRIGHSGTLDPNASGVLLVLVGNACKCLPYIEDTDKQYVATLKLGLQTISDDIWGEELARREVQPISDFQGLLNQIKGKIKQLPPYVSSIKINGKKLYEYARNHEFIERPLRDVEIYDIQVIDEEKLCFYTHCSSGTYIRSICRDIANLSGNLGCMSSLVRCGVGKFSLDDCFTLKQIEEGNYRFYTIKEILSHYKMIEYDKIDDLKNGRKIKIDCNEDMVVMLHQGEVIALYKKIKDGLYTSERGLW